ncbi:Ester hydrolase C11orf54-like [Porphyridium purpureum]|uniref:Ester hydrolase C11orf54-like n=1 Tax=Porphyridium purpureum TaxID=35688 RepID=A0A5J4YJD6_PORPP|nr:Ester hydrolase C11orf54-like [Porphyridium purpureum]|eukprot:POR1899..scf291_13
MASSVAPSPSRLAVLGKQWTDGEDDVLPAGMVLADLGSRTWKLALAGKARELVDVALMMVDDGCAARGSEAAALLPGVALCQRVVDVVLENSETVVMCVYEPLGLVLLQSLLMCASSLANRILYADASEWRRRTAVQVLQMDASRVLDFEQLAVMEKLPGALEHGFAERVRLVFVGPVSSAQADKGAELGVRYSAAVSMLSAADLDTVTKDEILRVSPVLDSAAFQNVAPQLVSHRYPSNYRARAEELRDHAGVVMLDMEDSASLGQQLSVEELALQAVSLEQLCAALQDALSENFASVTAGIAECANLREWGLAHEGLGSSSAACSLLDIGGNPYMESPPQHHRRFDVRAVAARVGASEPYAVYGPGAGSSRLHGQNCEVFWSMRCDAAADSIVADRLGPLRASDDAAPDHPAGTGGPELGPVVVLNRIGRLDGENRPESVASSALECGPLANLVLSDGLPGSVVHVIAQKRTGTKDFGRCLRDALLTCVGESGEQAQTAAGLGGVFQMRAGSIKGHIMPDFSTSPLRTEAGDVQKWLKFFQVSPRNAFTAVNYTVSHDPSASKHLGLRLEHTHFFEDRNFVGHYHYDTSPDTIIYEGYFLPATRLFRVSNPSVSHLHP